MTLSTVNATQKATRNVTKDNATFFVAMTMQTAIVLTDLWQSFGRKVRERREKLGLTQEAAGKRAKMKRQQWNRIEQGASTKRPTLFRIATALEIDPKIVLDWAGFKLDGTESRAGVDTVEEALESAMYFDKKGLSEADKEKLRPYLEAADLMADRLKRQPAIPRDDDERMTAAEFDRKHGQAVKRIPSDEKADTPIKRSRPIKRSKK